MKSAWGVVVLTLTVSCNGTIGAPGEDKTVPARSGNNSATPTTGGSANSPGDMNVAPFVPLPRSASLAKVKMILTSLPPTAIEIAAVEKDPGALRALIQQWMQLPEYLANRREFFEQAFQQKPAFRTAELFPLAVNASLLQNMDESFARTVEATVDAGEPFNTPIKSNQFMMTLPMMVYYAAVDTIALAPNALSSLIDDSVNFTFESDAGPIPIEQTLDPSSPNFMTWYDPTVTKVSSVTPADCLIGGRMVTSLDNAGSNLRGQNKTIILYSYLFNNSFQTWVMNVKPSVRCFFPSPNAPTFADKDYSTWRSITIRQPQAGEPTTRFWDLATMRAKSDLVLNQRRVGFFTTPGFLAQWPSNASNESRVTANQTLIVALNRAFDGATAVTPGMNLEAVDSSHAPATSSCYSCHRTMDPMRQFFVQDYNYDFSAQADRTLVAVPAWFDFLGVSVAGTGLGDLGTQLANHPSFASAWTQKLCNYANSSPCDVNDPELLRVASVFEKSGLDWNALVVELFSSPLVTYASSTMTAATTGETVSIARRYQFCSRISARLNVPDVCGVLPTSTPPRGYQSLSRLAQAIPSDAYARGGVTPPLVVQPGLMFRSTMENFCAALAPFVVDSTATGPKNDYKSTGVPSAVNDMATNLMGVAPGTEAPVVAILQHHYDAAVQSGSSPTTALRSTFMLACLAPPTIAIGL